VPVEDRWIFSRINSTAEQANRAIEQYRYHEAAQLLWQFFWHEFCDWYVEIKKLRFQENSGLDPHWRNLLAAFENALRLLHPAMPFITEELWQRLVSGNPNRPRSIAVASYPQYRSHWTDFAAEREVGLLQEIVTLARTLRTEMKLDPKQQLDGTLYSRTALEVGRRHAEAVQRLANVRLTFSSDAAPQSATMRSTAEFDLVLNVPQGQADAQRKRLEKEREQLEKNIANSNRQLSDETFLSKAPARVVETIRTKLAEYEAQLAKVRAALDGLQ
jgi:valyl-tRNA synthetase